MYKIYDIGNKALATEWFTDYLRAYARQYGAASVAEYISHANNPFMYHLGV